jgi:hypothetical protein
LQKIICSFVNVTRTSVRRVIAGGFNVLALTKGFESILFKSYPDDKKFVIFNRTHIIIAGRGFDAEPPHPVNAQRLISMTGCVPSEPAISNATWRHI